MKRLYYYFALKLKGYRAILYWNLEGEKFFTYMDREFHYQKRVIG